VSYMNPMSRIHGQRKRHFFLLSVPARLVSGVTRLAFGTGYRTGRLTAGSMYLAFRVGRATARFVGYRRLITFSGGAFVGLLIAPAPGREMRATLSRYLKSRLQTSDLADPVLADKVRFELSHHPRTWHLAQPEVTVWEGRVSLRGQVPDEATRTKLVQVASAFPGVTGVDDLLEVSDTAAGA
jgi:osmotically-inducible protein OsmY